MRELDIGTKRFTKVIVKDYPGEGGACHEYEVRENHPAEPAQGGNPFANVSFQNGPIKENGVNGCHQEDLLAIVIDRLESFQKGYYSCLENALALKSIKDGLAYLNRRTNERENRGVEGKSKK